MKNKTLVVGPGRKTRGGITSVINSYTRQSFWKTFNCIWIETYIDKGSFYKIFFFMRALLRFIINLSGADIVHIHLSGKTSAFRKNIFLRIAKLFRKKVILHFHAFSSEKTLFGSKKKLYQKMFEKADCIIALSGFWKSQIAKIISNPEMIYVVYNPCDSKKRLPQIEKQSVILYAGTLNQRKGYVDLINAFSQIAHKYPDWKIVFAGNGEIEKGQMISKELNIEKQVDFKGWVAGKEKEELFSGASIFCLPSYAEGFPMAILDAWTYELPVITTPVGGLPDILINGENAMVFIPGDTAGLTDNLEKLITSGPLRDKLREASLNLKNNQFNIKTISGQITDIYREIAS